MNALLLGAHAPSRAADGALAVGRFQSARTEKRLFGRWRPNQHARARALPGVRAAFSLILAALIGATAQADAITLDAALSRTLEKNPEIVQARLALEAGGRPPPRLSLHDVSRREDARRSGRAGRQTRGRTAVAAFRVSRAVFSRNLFSTPRFQPRAGAATSKS